MRILELLSEANLQKSDFTVKSRLEKFIEKLENREPFTIGGQKEIIDASAEEIQELKSFLNSTYKDDTTVRKEETKGLPSIIGGVRLASIFKTDEFGGRSSAESANIGPAVEILKAMAIYATLINRSDDPISIKDIVYLAHEIQQNSVLGTSSEKSKTKTYSCTIEKEVPDKSGNVKDHLVLSINLNKGPFLRAVNLKPTDDKLLTKLSGIIKYVNSESDLRKYSKFFANNAKRDPIKIECIGGQGLKTDIKTTYLKGKDDNEQSKVLKHLSMSIKSESSQIDQSPGTDSSGIQKFFRTLGLDTQDAIEAMDLAGYNGKTKGKTSTLEDHKDRAKACAEMLRLAGEKLDEKLSRMDDRGEASFIHHFLGSLTKAMTGGEDLVYVNFDAKGSYYKLNPNLIRNLSEHIDLETKVHVTPRGTSYLYIMDKNSSRSLFHVRLMISKKERIAYFFELDDLLDLVKESSTSWISKTPTNPPKIPIQAKMQHNTQNVPAGIVNQRHNLSQKIPMGQEPESTATN
jgi:vacuolar-type H+-ATPase subunit E/Vma4